MSLSIEETEDIVNRFLRDYNGNIPLSVRIAETPEDLYGPAAKDLGIEGGYHAAQGLFTLAAVRLQSAAHARKVIRHEILGHYGLNTFTPDDKRDLLHRVLETRQEPSLKPFWDRVDRDYADQPELFKAEEVFAFVAEDERRFTSRAWDKTRAVFARALRKAGLIQSPLTLPELRQTAQSVATGIRNGTRLQQTFPENDQAQFRKDTQMSEKKSYRDQVVEELLSHIEAGTAPFQKPWDPGKVRLGPFNPVSGANYRGINALWLELRGHEDPRWMTYRQATQHNAQVRKGEKGTKIEYWKWTDKRALLDDEGRPVLDDNGKVKTREVRLDRPQVFHAVVFNAEQIDGLAPFIAPKPAFEPAERAEELLRQGEVPIRHDQLDRAFYRPMTDEIHLPPKRAFRSQYDYYATALHELGHATGHQSRMAREFGPFGSEVYAKEELRAEIASYMLTTELGLGHYPERHAAYVGNWMKAIKEDRNFLFTAARDAEQIRTWVTEPGKREQLKPVLSQEQRQEERQEVSNMVGKNRIVPDLEDMPAQGVADQVFDRQVEHTAVKVKEDWMLHAARLDGLPDTEARALNDAKNSFQRIDVWWQYSDDPDKKDRSFNQERETFTTMADLAGRSAKHAELLSAMYDAHHDQEYFKPLRPQWFLPETQRTSELVKSLGADPGQTIAERFIAEQKQARQESRAKELAAQSPAISPSEKRQTFLIDSRFKENKRFETLDAAVREFAAHYDDTNSTLETTINGEQRLLIGNSWYNDGSNHRYTYITPELKAHHKAHFAAKKQGPVPQEIITASEKSIAAKLAPKITRSEQVQVTDQVAETKQPASSKRHYLNVPYSEKNEAKALGAKWDRRAKSWYVRDDADLKPFARWNEPAVAKPQSRIRPEEEFALACRENGLVIDGLPTMDGKWHRVSVESDRKGQKSGSYRGFIEGIPAGNIVNYKSGNEPVKWVSSAAERNPAEIERSKAEAAARKAQMEENLKAQYKQVAKRAYAMVQGADTASSDHVYLQRKQVSGETLKEDIHNNLLMPMTNAKGFIENVQVITPDGSKRFLKDGRKTGLMHMIPGSKKGPILIAEGFATGKSLNMATGYQTAIAMDSGNLAPVAETLQKAFPDRPLIIAADDDHGVEAKQGVNPGIKGAERAAARVEGAVIRPNLSPAEKQAGLTDYNDLHVARGIDSLAKTVKQQIKELGLTQKVQKARTLPAPKQQQRSQRQQVAI
ncbi:zincin-like metallopeptidase domain-containing protein [Thalassospira profundimaris]|uniref:zincin-like metallopeptidase domain-containing protein n=1 Tax=Thalassospira profundimaris TaxID=502049 RepID=UPI0015F0AFAC|nr:zincin-like metallopeptidase domain-containing protein [Thalassospira profundimaris]